MGRLSPSFQFLRGGSLAASSKSSEILSSSQMLRSKTLTPSFKLFEILSSSERRQLAFLLSMILLMALLDALGVASIMPFIGVIANPELIQSNAILFHLNQFFGSKTDTEFLFILGIMLFIILIFTQIIINIKNQMKNYYTHLVFQV